MSKVMKSIFKALVLIVIGGITYTSIELLWRGRTHISMFFLGGVCFYLIGLLNEVATWEDPLALQCLCGSMLITVLEFITGSYVNCYLGLNVWDYSSLPFNFMGQICLFFSICWYFLSLVAIILDDYLRYFIFKEEKPQYKIV